MNPNLPTGETFSEGSDLPPALPPAPPMAGGNEDCVSLEALAMPDDGEQMQTPAIGDLVNYTTEGKITRIEGGKAYVARSSVNGQPVEPDADDMGGQSDGDADNLDKLSADAAGMSEQM
jgi:hypothetical protein